MSDELLKQADEFCGVHEEWTLVKDLAARVRELEAERDALRSLLTPVPSFLIALAERITHPCPLKDTTVNTRRAIEAALAKGKV